MAKITKAGGPSFGPDEQPEESVIVRRAEIGYETRVPAEDVKDVEEVTPEKFDKFVEETPAVEIVETEDDDDDEEEDTEDEFDEFETPTPKTKPAPTKKATPKKR